MSRAWRELIAVGLLFAVATGCGDDAEVGVPSVATSARAVASTASASAPTDAPTSTASPTTVSASTPVSPPATTSGTVPALASFPAGRCCVGQAVEPGRYRLPGVALSVEVGAQWRAIREGSVSLFALVQGTNVIGDASRWMYFFVLPPSLDADSLLGQVENMPEVIIVASRAPVRIGGFAGTQLDAVAAPNPDFAGSPTAGIPPGTQHLPAIEQLVSTGFSITTASPEAVLRFITLDADGRTLLVYAEASPDEFAAFIAEADAVLASLQAALD